jgi:hypothetical protein
MCTLQTDKPTEPSCPIQSWSYSQRERRETALQYQCKLPHSLFYNITVNVLSVLQYYCELPLVCFTILLLTSCLFYNITVNYLLPVLLYYCKLNCLGETEKRKIRKRELNSNAAKRGVSLTAMLLKERGVSFTAILLSSGKLVSYCQIALV